MKKKLKVLTLSLIGIVLLISLGGFYWYKSWRNKFKAPRQEAQPVQFCISKEATLMGVTGNLHYYGFIKDENAFKYALEHAKDNTPDQEGVIKIGSNTIKKQAVYEVSQTMNAWSLASVLLNDGKFSDCSAGYTHMFYPELLPGGDLAPGVEEIYKWVKTYEDCVKAIGHDGGQVTSEEALRRTSHPRVCNTADGRYFVQGKEGFSDYPPYP